MLIINKAPERQKAGHGNFNTEIIIPGLNTKNGDLGFYNLLYDIDLEKATVNLPEPYFQNTVYLSMYLKVNSIITDDENLDLRVKEMPSELMNLKAFSL